MAMARGLVLPEKAADCHDKPPGSLWRSCRKTRVSS